jgi:hypothetical protein
MDRAISATDTARIGQPDNGPRVGELDSRFVASYRVRRKRHEHSVQSKIHLGLFYHAVTCNWIAAFASSGTGGPAMSFVFLK